jgi:hypothetical protein
VAAVSGPAHPGPGRLLVSVSPTIGEQQPDTLFAPGPLQGAFEWPGLRRQRRLIARRFSRPHRPPHDPPPSARPNTALR